MKKFLVAVVAVLVVVQFIRPVRNLSAEPAGPRDLAVMYPPTPEVKAVLARACYDCHSDNTRYPWYANVQPVGWWLANHVNDGKRHLNFSNFGALPELRQYRKLGGVINVLKKHEMPLSSYTLIHTDARLTDAETKSLSDWVAAIRAKLP
ncbi:MAG: heme-binding domain-containing protein, partial [Opitutales bacterium]